MEQTNKPNPYVVNLGFIGAEKVRVLLFSPAGLVSIIIIVLLLLFLEKIVVDVMPNLD